MHKMVNATTLECNRNGIDGKPLVSCDAIKKHAFAMLENAARNERIHRHGFSSCSFLLLFCVSIFMCRLNFRRALCENSSRVTATAVATVTQSRRNIIQARFLPILFILFKFLVSLCAMNIWHNGLGLHSTRPVNITITRHAINCHQTKINSDLLFLFRSFVCPFLRWLCARSRSEQQNCAFKRIVRMCRIRSLSLKEKKHSFSRWQRCFSFRFSRSAWKRTNKEKKTENKRIH